MKLNKIKRTIALNATKHSEQVIARLNLRDINYLNGGVCCVFTMVTPPIPHIRHTSVAFRSMANLLKFKTVAHCGRIELYSKFFSWTALSFIDNIFPCLIISVCNLSGFEIFFRISIAAGFSTEMNLSRNLKFFFFRIKKVHQHISSPYIIDMHVRHIWIKSGIIYENLILLKLVCWQKQLVKLVSHDTTHTHTDIHNTNNNKTLCSRTKKRFPCAIETFFSTQAYTNISTT